MTTTEHLQKIKDHCERLLALSEIANCGSGAAEAGWRTTIAIIDILDPRNPAYIGVYDSCEDNEAIQKILAAWPIELLQT